MDPADRGRTRKRQADCNCGWRAALFRSQQRYKTAGRTRLQGRTTVAAAVAATISPREQTRLCSRRRQTSLQAEWTRTEPSSFFPDDQVNSARFFVPHLRIQLAR